MKKKSYRTTMPFDGGLSPLTELSKVPTYNIPRFTDNPKMPGAGGSWSQDDISNRTSRGEYADDGDLFKRKEIDIGRINYLKLKQIENKEIWRVKTEGGSKDFDSFQAALNFQHEMAKLKKPVFYISKLANSNKEKNKDFIILNSLSKTFTINSIYDQNNIEIRSSGSCFCVFPGYLLTCAHVLYPYSKHNPILEDWKNGVENTKIEITGNSQVSYGDLISFDLIKDIALLKSNVDSDYFEFNTDFKIGEEIISIGNPHGIGNNLSIGNISSLDKKIYKKNTYPKFIFFDMSLYKGNSGGPVISFKDGKLIGMVVLVISEEGDYGLNAGIDSSIIKNFCSSNIPNFK